MFIKKGVSQAVIVLLILGAAATLSAQTAGEWLDPAWSARTAVAIVNPGFNVSNYQVNIQLDSRFSFAQAKADGADLRVTAADGITLLPFWIESWVPSTSASLWVKLPSLGAGTSTTVYLYYGNPQASSTADGARVFDFYDGFDTRPLNNAATWQITPTYEGSGQVVHPSIVYFPNGWHGYEYWMGITPYPFGNASYENPSILVSHDGATWTAPPGIVNPVALPTTSYLNDPDLLYDANSDRLWLYYLHSSIDGVTYVDLKTSPDGVNWGPQAAETRLFSVPGDNMLSPAVLKVGSAYWVWSVLFQSGGCSAAATTFEVRTSNDGINWSAPTTANLTLPGYVPWHLDIIYVPSKGEFWSLIAAYPIGAQCSATVLFFAKSTDGVNWTAYTGPVLETGEQWDQNQIYRSTLLYDEAKDLLRVWYTADDSGQVWHMGYTERTYADFVSILSSGGGGWNGPLRYSSGSSWSRSSEQSKRGTYSGKMVQMAGPPQMTLTKPQPLSSSFYQEWDMYDDLDPTALKIARVAVNDGTAVGVGVWTGSSTNFYSYNDTHYHYTPTGVPRSLGWHKFGIRLEPDATATFYIDGQQVGSLAGQISSAKLVMVEGYSAGDATTSTFYVDDIRIRKYSNPEPYASLGNNPSFPLPTQLALNPTTVGSGSPATGTVTLSGPAPSSGAAVELTSSNPAAASVPTSVTVSGGSSSATFPVTTHAVAASTTVTITASYNGTSERAPLTVTPPLTTYTIAGTISPATSGAGATVTLTQGATTIATVTAATDGTYTFPSVVNGTYTVTPTKTGLTFTPASAPVTVNGANVSGINFTAVGLAIDVMTSTDRGTATGTSIATPAFTTRAGNELLLAFISTAASSTGGTSNITVSGVSGGGLTWTLVRRTNAQLGTSEIWRAFATGVVTNATVTASLSQTGMPASITVVTFAGVNATTPVGAAGGGSAATGAPTASLTTQGANSWVFGVGNDWDGGVARTVGANQTKVHEYLSPSGDTFWVQRQNATVQPVGTVVTINDTAPTNHRWNLSLVEIRQ